MDEAPPPSSDPPPSTPERSPDRNSPPVPALNEQYWCYSCDKRVLVDTEGVDIVCRECKNGFVESIAFSSVTQGDEVDFVDDDLSIGSQIFQALGLIAEESRDSEGGGDGDGDAVPPPQPPTDHLPDDDFLRIELDRWHDNEDEEEVYEEYDSDWEQDDDVEEQEVEEEEEENDFQDGDQIEDGEESDTEQDINEVNIENHGHGVVDDDEEEREEDVLRRHLEVLHLRIRDIASRANSGGRNRILNWAEILMRLEDNSIDLQLELPETDEYFGNPEDYVDAAGYEALLHNLAESDQTGRKGAPAAAKSAVAELHTVVIADSGCEACAICKDSVNVGDSIKKMPCGHGYHGNCIVPWLESRNSCPVCRYELPTDDLEYEEERKKKLGASASNASGSGLI